MHCPSRAITWTHQQAPAAPWSRGVVHTSGQAFMQHSKLRNHDAELDSGSLPGRGSVRTRHLKNYTLPTLPRAPRGKKQSDPTLPYLGLSACARRPFTPQVQRVFPPRGRISPRGQLAARRCDEPNDVTTAAPNVFRRRCTIGCERYGSESPHVDRRGTGGRRRDCGRRGQPHVRRARRAVVWARAWSRARHSPYHPESSERHRGNSRVIMHADATAQFRETRTGSHSTFDLAAKACDLQSRVCPCTYAESHLPDARGQPRNPF